MNRILMVLRPDRGGAFNHVADLTSALSKRGFDVTLCGPVEHRAQDLSVPVVPLSIEREVRPAKDLASVARYIPILRRIKPDLVHAHGSKGSLVARLGRVASPRTPVICTPHLYPFDNYFASDSQRRLYRGVERTLAPLATRVIGVCESERILAAEVGPSSRTRTVHNGVSPVAAVPPHPVYSEIGQPTIATVAELRESKGVSTLLEAMAILRDQVPNARLVIAGDGDERASLERQVEALGLGESVRLIGATDGPASVLAGATIFVNAAWAEAFPYTIIEAMSLGKPIVATDVGGSREAVEDGVTGLLVPARDATSLASALARAITDHGLQSHMGENARERYLAQFTLEEMVERTVAVYAELGMRGDRAD